MAISCVGANLLPGDLILVPRRLEHRAPVSPDDVSSEAREDIPWRGWRLERLVLTRFVVGEDVFAPVRGDREPKAKAASIPGALLHPVHRRFRPSLGLKDGKGHPP